MNAKTYVFARPAALRPDAVLVFGSGFLATQAMATLMYVLPIEAPLSEMARRGTRRS